MLFCNIGWMKRYEGQYGQPDKIVGGGSYVDTQAHGHEVCNFLENSDGWVYGHVETIKGKLDRNLNIERLGGKGGYVSEVDVVWTATNPDRGGRYVIGWYRKAIVFRKRQFFKSPPSRQHEKDELTSYRIKARSKDVHRLDSEERNLLMGTGSGRMGRTPWWYPLENPSSEVKRFLAQVIDLMNYFDDCPECGFSKKKGENSSSPSRSPYVRYFEAYEKEIHPYHNELQSDFVRYLKDHDFKDVQENISFVDLRFSDPSKGLILAEVKPCSFNNSRYAIRTAIGQLLDYQQRENEESNLLIVLGVCPNPEDRDLAMSNGFGLAYPLNDNFKVIWPNSWRDIDTH